MRIASSLAPSRRGEGWCAVLLKGLTTRGTVRFVPFSSERLMLFSFVDKPDLDVKLNVRGRFIGSQSIPQFAFLRSAIIAAVQRDFVDPNYGVVPLEYAPVVVRRRRRALSRIRASLCSRFSVPPRSARWTRRHARESVVRRAGARACRGRR